MSYRWGPNCLPSGDVELEAEDLFLEWNGTQFLAIVCTLMSSLRNPGMPAGNIDIPWLYRPKFQAWPSRLMTNAPSYAEGGSRNASTPPTRRG
uniref:Uncharacterized protein n=1 Tax=Vespula pensylvanica TaxID=30213 RepID=A0A834UEG2_VESPE|nr:hypothetical protein H0235_002733 [Vespula pensylvanica]